MEQIEKLQSEALTKIADCQNNQDLNAVRVEYLGKKGPIQNLMKGMKDYHIARKKTCHSESASFESCVPGIGRSFYWFGLSSDRRRRYRQ